MKTSDFPDHFPNLPNSLQKVQQFFAGNEFDTKKLVTLLEQDPLLCANILRLANSAAYGGKNKIASLTQAVTRLGFTVTRGVIMASFVQKSFPIQLDIYGIDLASFDAINQTRVQLLKTCFYNPQLDMQMLQSVTFLLESSKIVTAYLVNKIGQTDHFRVLLGKEGVQKAEEELFGIDGYKIGAMLFAKWGFEENFVKLVQNLSTPQNREGQLLLILSVAANTTGILRAENQEQIASLCKDYKLDWAKISECLKSQF